VTTAGHREAAPTGVRVCVHPGLGFRVVAVRPIGEGETIERAPLVDFPEEEWNDVTKTVLGAYAVRLESGGGGVALGYGSLYGHSPTPSARCLPRSEDRALEIVADRDVTAGEEIHIEGTDPPPTSIPSHVTIDPPADVSWGPSPERGRGVFAARDLVAGETIEVSPCITFPANEWKRIEKTRFDDYCFVWGSDRKDGTLPLGYGSLYNHSFEPNATYVRRLAEHVMDFVAIRDIAAGDEIRTNYNRDPLDMTPVWFEVVP
jgi:uncharacterized protein